jgi:Chromo (CHRromatin Organisation MOdifier) domain
MQVPQVLVKWRQLGYDVATWEQLPDLKEVDGAAAELERFHSLQPIADEAQHAQQVVGVCCITISALVALIA